MPPRRDKRPSLPSSLLRELSVPAPDHTTSKGRSRPFSRKERRKVERSQRKLRRNVTTRHSKPPVTPAARDKRSVVVNRTKDRVSRQEEQNLEEGSISYDENGESSEVDVKQVQDTVAVVPRAVRERLAEDDAEIADLERKLGIKGRKSLPKSFHDDGLGDLLADIDALDDAARETKKRKAEAEEWLAQKRRKNLQPPAGPTDIEEEEHVLSETLSDSFEDFESSGEDDEDTSVDEDDPQAFNVDTSEHGDDTSGFELEQERSLRAPVRVRENPYVAPTSGLPVANYVPPSRRQEPGSDAELLPRLRRHLQGLVNRITESNLVAILGDVEKVYREQPRQHVTSILTDLILTQVSDPTSLPDTLLVLSAGFSTAVFKVVGMDFGAQLVQETVDRFDKAYKRAVSLPNEATKETSNLITFLTELYNFQLLGCNLIFDYIRLLLGDLSELNAELLLRIIRLSGHALRQDDPSSLKDIVALIRPAVAKIGESNVSVRTKFMIETINDLKNNKVKAGASSSVVLSEHMGRMKKTLGSLNLRKLKSTEPLGMGLRDILDSNRKGKWWLVGASWAGRSDADQNSPSNIKRHGVAGRVEGDSDSDGDSDVPLIGGEDGMPDLAELAREQMMNTDVRRAIFVAILSATDYEDAYIRVMKLRLNKDRQREIPNVILQCAGAEQQYNPYYTLIAKRLCADRKMRWTFQDCLWKLFKRMGESIFGDEPDNVEEDEAIEMRRLANIARMYGTLIREGALGLNVLKCLNMPYLQTRTRSFVEVLLISSLLDCFEAGKDGKIDAEAAIGKMIATLGDAPELCRGLQWFFKKVMRKSDLIGSKTEAKTLKTACTIAERALEATLVAEALDGP
ncbi:hypothetical protein VTK73DRAFT_5430 [Phialemonium thermophilum]|uniref:MI domain-containing protein n=1 Tax=Phialemonium thermophilum TaxID=223376 RepID=A0ABR3WNN2_9PEZI